MADQTINPNADPMAEAVAAAQASAASENASPTEQDVVDSDPFEAARLAAAATEDTSPNEQDVIDSDPFEAARLAAAAEEDTSPNEQTVIEASSDEELHAKSLRDLEAEQIANRAALQSSDKQDAAATMAASDAKASTKTSNNDATKFEKKSDWRVRLSLSPGANYLYKAAKAGDLLFPLKGTDGIVFPYLPQVTVNYRANYDPTDITHSNYKLFMYKNSAVEDVQITADFTAQDTSEANYMLAVIHFLKSATKMFYGQDGKSGPRAGTPPPLCYLSGFGAYQFDNHPLVITNFNYSLPNDVDYIRAGVTSTWGGQSITQYGTKEFVPNGVFGQMSQGIRDFRLKIGNLKAGAAPKEPDFKSLTNTEATYVPTKMQIQIAASPIVTRNDISNNFSLTEYATGKLLRGSQRSGGGIW